MTLCYHAIPAMTEGGIFTDSRAGLRVCGRGEQDTDGGRDPTERLISQSSGRMSRWLDRRTLDAKRWAGLGCRTANPAAGVQNRSVLHTPSLFTVLCSVNHVTPEHAFARPAWVVRLSSVQKSEIRSVCTGKAQYPSAKEVVTYLWRCVTEIPAKAYESQIRNAGASNDQVLRAVCSCMPETGRFLALHLLHLTSFRLQSESAAGEVCPRCSAAPAVVIPVRRRD